MALLVAGVLALSAWQGQLSRDAAGAHWGVAGLVVATVLAALTLGHGRQQRTSGAQVKAAGRAIRAWRDHPGPHVISVGVWTAVILAVVGWDLVSFMAQSHLLPTLSYFIGRVTRYSFGRSAFFALWLALGFYLAAGWRTEAP
jgi:hypothetical protein